MNWIPYGPGGWLLRFAEQLGDETFARGRAIAAELERSPPEGLIEFVPGFTTVLLEFAPTESSSESIDRPAQLAALSRRLERAFRHPPGPAPIREIPVVYDGPDLERVARTNGLKLEEVAELHSTTIYKVYLLGFAPGFPYLGDLDRRLHTPRLSAPRPRVAAGSVAIGGEHTGIYSVASPGGWNIIGRTSVQLFDPERKNAEPARGDSPGPESAMFWLRAGDRVRFKPTKA
jgi:inhibitor of KinA